MNTTFSDVNIIKQFQQDMKGVFTLSDLKGMFPTRHLNSFYRRIANLEKIGVLRRYMRGIYVAEEFDLTVVSQKIDPDSYISFETVLAKEMVIGTIPKNEVKAVKVGKRRAYRSALGNVLHLGVARHLYFGFETIDGVNFAAREKALLDMLYFFSKGMRFYLDIYSDVNLKKIRCELVEKYLSKYRNPKFVKFVRTYLQGMVR